MAKRRVSPNARWLHLSSAENDLKFIVQAMLFALSTYCSAMMQLLGILFALEATADVGDVDADALDFAIESLLTVLVAYTGMLHTLRTADSFLFDIPPEEENAPLLLTRPKGLRIDDLCDISAYKMTHFYHGQLCRLYAAFDLESQLGPMQDKLSFPTGHITNGTPCCYRIHPEEVFLFTLCRLATGWTQVHIVDTYFGGDKNRWTHAYTWMLKYIDDRYAHVIGHQGLTRFVDDFPLFKRAIERYVQRDHQRELVDGTMTIVPGLNHLPWDVFGFIDDSIDKISTPCSGPRGDYEGAARKPEYADAQQAFYSGYTKAHGIKIESILLPNGISTIFGPVSSRRADTGVLLMSNLNNYLVELQRGRFFTREGAEVYYSGLSDSAFDLGLQCIQELQRSRVRCGSREVQGIDESCENRDREKLCAGKQWISHLLLKGGQQNRKTKSHCV